MFGNACSFFNTFLYFPLSATVFMIYFAFSHAVIYLLSYLIFDLLLIAIKLTEKEPVQINEYKSNGKTHTEQR